MALHTCGFKVHQIADMEVWDQIADMASGQKLKYSSGNAGALN